MFTAVHLFKSPERLRPFGKVKDLRRFRQQLIYMKKFLSQYEWHKLQPCFNGNEYYDPQKATNYSAAHIGEEIYIAYLYGTAQNGHGKFQNMKNGTYEMIWFNCRTGESTVSEIVVEDTTYTIPNKPDKNDWTIAVVYKG